MMDFYSMEKIAFAKQVEDHEIAASAHLARKAVALQIAARKSVRPASPGLLSRLTALFGPAAAGILPGAPAPRLP